MDEILAKLLESELLSADSKTAITEGFTNAVETMRTSLKEEVELEVRAELVEQWTAQRDALVEAVDEKVTELVEDEVSELKEDISKFRDLEAEQAKAIVEEKYKMAGTLAEELDGLVDQLDSFLELRITEEMNELKEDLEDVRKNEFGREMFEAFSGVFNSTFVDSSSVQSKLNIAEHKLKRAEKALVEMEAAKADALRAQAMESVLAPLDGVKREQMSLILNNVETSKLQESYNMFIGRILKESAPVAEVKKPLVESVKPKPARKRVVTGNKLDESVKKPEADKSDLKRTLALAGL